MAKASLDLSAFVGKLLLEQDGDVLRGLRAVEVPPASGALAG